MLLLIAIWCTCSFPMLQVMEIPGAKAAVEKEWSKLEKIDAWQLKKGGRAKKDVIPEAHKEKRKVHFATLMNMCHLENASIEPKHPKFKGRVVPLRETW